MLIPWEDDMPSGPPMADRSQPKVAGVASARKPVRSSLCWNCSLEKQISDRASYSHSERGADLDRGAELNCGRFLKSPDKAETLDRLVYYIIFVV